MREILTRLENETEEEFIARAYRNRTELGMTNKELNEELNNILGTSYAESSMRCKATAWNNGFYNGYDKALEGINNNDILTKIEEKEIEFKEERTRLNDIRRKINTYARENGRYKNNIEMLERSIQELAESKPMGLHESVKIVGKNEAVLVLSDLHIGINISNYFNTYNVQVAKERLELLANKVIDKCSLHGVNKLHILVNGDLISGAIHKQLISDADCSLIDSITKGSEMISETIDLISSVIDNVEVYFAVGNHSRIDPNKKENLKENNFEYLMFEYIKLRLNNIDNIHFNTNKYHNEIIDFKVFDKDIIAMHGDKDRPSNVAKNMTSFLGFKPYKIYLGHYHSYNSFDSNGTHVTVNGSMVSTDEYAFGLRLNSESYQVLTIFDYDSKEEECEYKIKLK